MGRSSRWSRPPGPGLIAVEVVEDSSQALMAAAMIEIACADRPLIRLREGISAEVLERVLRVCQRLRREDVAVRSC